MHVPLEAFVSHRACCGGFLQEGFLVVGGSADGWGSAERRKAAVAAGTAFGDRFGTTYLPENLDPSVLHDASAIPGTLRNLKSIALCYPSKKAIQMYKPLNPKVLKPASPQP